MDSQGLWYSREGCFLDWILERVAQGDCGANDRWCHSASSSLITKGWYLGASRKVWVPYTRCGLSWDCYIDDCRYVVNLCAEAPSPISSKTQVEVGVRELRLYARKEAANELPECRNTDLYSLFRALDIQNIVALFEYALSESRIILLSSHTSMLQLVSRALVSLMYPLNWLGIYIPVLPSRLISALEVRRSSLLAELRLIECYRHPVRTLWA